MRTNKHFRSLHIFLNIIAILTPIIKEMIETIFIVVVVVVVAVIAVCGSIIILS